MRGDGVGDRLERIEGARVHLAGLRADDRRARRRGRQRGAQRVGAHAALRVGGDAPRAARAAPQPQHLQRGQDRRVHLLAHEDRDRRRAGEALLFDVVAGPTQDGVAGGGQRGEARHRGAGGEAGAGAGRQAEQLHQPGGGGLLGDGGRGRGDEGPGVLVPRRGEPVGGERGRQRAAGHEAEVAGAGARDETRIGRAREAFDDRCGLARVLGERAAERAAQRSQIGGRTDGALAHALEPVDRERGGALEGGAPRVRGRHRLR